MYGSDEHFCSAPSAGLYGGLPGVRDTGPLERSIPNAGLTVTHLKPVIR